jgi:hypothetical protein
MRLRGNVVPILCAMTVAGVLLPGPAAAPADLGVQTVQVGGSPISGPLATGFVSFSFEYPALREYAGGDPAHLNPVLVALLRGLAPAGGSVLRVGGNSTDQTWWPVRGLTRPGGVNYSLTRGWLQVARSLAQSTGSRLLPGVNLAANRPALAAAEARSLLDGIGRRNLAGLEIGNEPDLYASHTWFRDRRGRAITARGPAYGLPRQISEFSRWRAVLPRVPIAGPAWATLGWGTGLGSFLDAEPRLAAVTLHRYPLRACTSDPTQANYPSIANLLAARSSQGLAQALAPSVQVAHSRRLPFRLDELNSASCSGRRGVSDTFASALWLADTLFDLAAVGVDGVNLHTLPRAAYQPFSFTHPRSGWRGTVAPLYYGALFFTRAFPAGARLLPVSTSGPLSAWATVDAQGTVRTTLINKSPAPVTAELEVPGGAWAPLSSQALLAPSIDATGGVSLAGQSFGASTATGTLPGAPATGSVPGAIVGYAVTVPPYSALLLNR